LPAWSSSSPREPATIVDVNESFTIRWRTFGDQACPTWRVLRARVFLADDEIEAVIDSQGNVFTAADVLAVPINDLGYPTGPLTRTDPEQ
jgi:hypothetical protein